MDFSFFFSTKYFLNFIFWGRWEGAGSGRQGGSKQQWEHWLQKKSGLQVFLKKKKKFSMVQGQ